MALPGALTIGGPVSTTGTSPSQILVQGTAGVGLTLNQRTDAAGLSAIFLMKSSTNYVGMRNTAGSLQFGYGPDAGNCLGGTGGEWARFDTSGNLLVGVTSHADSCNVISKSHPSGYSTVIQNTSGTSPYGLKIAYTGVATGTGNDFLRCYDGAMRLTIGGGGNVQNVNNSYGAISDIKLKENISTARSYLDDLCSVNIVKYSLISEQSDHATHLGVIAQELEQIFPGMIEETKDTAERPSGKYEQIEIAPAVMDGELVVTPAIYADDETKPIIERYETGEVTKGVKYSVFVPMLITAVQELKAKNDALEARLSAIEAKLAT